MKCQPLIAFLGLLAAISGGFIVAVKFAGTSGPYLAGFYMLGPALAAVVTRAIWYPRGFRDAGLGFGRLRHYLQFWLIALAVVLLSYGSYTVLGAVTWDFTGNTFLTQLRGQLTASGKDIADLPAGLTPRTMLVIFFVGGLTVFNLPTIVFGLGEEFGWRGFLFPQLCRYGLRWAFIGGGLLWFAWHVPLALVLPQPVGWGLWQWAANVVLLAAGAVFSFIFFAYAYAKSGTIWVPALAHAVVNNASRAFAYFVKIEDQLLANLGLTLTMAAVVALLFRRGEFKVFSPFLLEDRSV